jgi:Ethylbenzene dehydrogenase/Prokaryotic cytochrome b561
VRPRKTDYGTIILHWLFVIACVVAFGSGLRIAAESLGQTWINLFDLLLPRSNVWTSHMQAAVVLIGLSLAYSVYLIRSGLSRRVRLDTVRLRALFGGRHARLSAIGIILNWLFFVTMLLLILSGGSLYFGIFAGHNVVSVHWWATWLVLVFAALHVLTHYMIGGASQLFRIFRPERLPPPPVRLDSAELLRVLAEPSARPAPGSDNVGSLRQYRPGPLGPQAKQGLRTRGPAPQRRSNMIDRGGASKPPTTTLQSNPLVVAAAVAIAGASALVAADRLAVDSLQIHRISTAEAPTLDGDTSDRVWRNIQPFSVTTTEGGNFDGKGETRVEIRAVHDGAFAYFLFTWDDPTRSLKQLPLIKEINGWRLLHNGYEAGDEHEYSEDKFSVLLTASDAILAGDRTFHAGPHPIQNAPATMTGRGLHFTEKGAGYVDVWEWKATSGGPTGWMDDGHFGPPLDPTPMQARYLTPYKGGFAPDPGMANYTENFVAWPEFSQSVTPRRLPKDLAAMRNAMGAISLDPNVSDSDAARWFMTEAESVPYTSELDRLIPVGTVLPGVIVAGEVSGDRADVRCAARWVSGHWTLEVARRLDTNSQYDVPLKTGTFMRVAAFDHNQIRHTRHVRPIRLQVDR